jgi:hypothetical protein
VLRRSGSSASIARTTSTSKCDSALLWIAPCGLTGTAGGMKVLQEETATLMRIPILRGKVGSYVPISRRKLDGGTGGYTGACFMKKRWVFRKKALRHDRKVLKWLA